MNPNNTFLLPAAAFALVACGGSNEETSANSHRDGSASTCETSDSASDLDDGEFVGSGGAPDDDAAGGTTGAPDPGAVPASEARVQIGCGVRHLSLSWSDIENATEYEVEQSVDGGVTFESFSPRIAERTFETEVSVHLTDWSQVQFRIVACHGDDCEATPGFDAAHVGVDCIGFVKTQAPVEEAAFGAALAMNGEGSLFAVGAPSEDEDTGSVTIFERDEAGRWQEEETLMGPHLGSSFGSALAMNDEGTTLVVGAPLEETLATGVDPETADATADAVGAVYVFERGDSGFVLAHILKASNAEEDDEFGASVSMSCDGTSLVVGAPQEDSESPQMNGNQDNGGSQNGAVYFFQRVAKTWEQTAYIKPSVPNQRARFGAAVELSCDGHVLAVGAPGNNIIGTSILPATSNPETSNSLTPAGAAFVFRLEDSTWTPDVIIRQESPEAQSAFGASLSFSGDGSWLAVGRERTGEESIHGAASLYYYDGVLWSFDGVAPAATYGGTSQLGRSVKLSRDASLLVVGASIDSSEGRGVGPIDIDGIDANSGSIFGYRRTDDGFVPAFTAKAKAPGSHSFGRALATSSDGSLLAVGAPGDNSNFTGISTVATEGLTARDSGAVYLF